MMTISLQGRNIFCGEEAQGNPLRSDIRLHGTQGFLPKASKLLKLPSRMALSYLLGGDG